MRRIQGILLFLILVLLTNQTHAYRIITPLPFSIANKNYVKIQVLKDKSEPNADSIICDIFYNTGSVITKKLDASLSIVLPLNSFNDGVFYVRARVFHSLVCDTIASPYSTQGIPVLLDRNPVFNERTFESEYYSPGKNLDKSLLDATHYEFNGNNNQFHFSSVWNEDSLYFRMQISDAQLNFSPPLKWDLYQAKNFLQVLWTSDCIELGFDLNHDHSEWKQSDDFELLADVKGHTVGNRWSIADSLFENWGKSARVTVSLQGTLNENRDIDTGYSILMAIPWSELKFIPKSGKILGFDIQLYDKDGEGDEPFRTSLSGTNPESNDNTSEWTNLRLHKSGSMPWYLFGLIPLVALLAIALKKKRKQNDLPEKVFEPDDARQPANAEYSDAIKKTIALIQSNYQDPELSRKKLADQVYLSEKYLSTVFKKETGENLLPYINRCRIQQAVILLQTTRQSISEIAFAVGYNSIQNFNKNFRDITGESPSDFRKHGS